MGARSRRDGDELVYVELEPGSAVAVEATIRTSSRALVADPASRSGGDPGSPVVPAVRPAARWSRPSPLVPGGGEIAASARGLVAARAADDDPPAVARAFFDELVEGEYRYVYPPPEPGSSTARGRGAATTLTPGTSSGSTGSAGCRSTRASAGRCGTSRGRGDHAARTVRSRPRNAPIAAVSASSPAR